jgi:hypothetical protein
MHTRKQVILFTIYIADRRCSFPCSIAQYSWQVSWHGDLLAVDRVYRREASLVEIISGSPLSPYAFVSSLLDAWEKEQE